MLPSKSDCYKLWDIYNLPQRKRTHSDIIANTAVFLGKKLRKKGVVIDLDLLTVACLLHDIDKEVVKKPGEKHPESAVRILKEEGLFEVAKVVRTHSLHCILNEKKKPQTWEQKVLYLCDKMVKYELIGVDKRFELWRAENLSPKARMILATAYPKVKALEKSILAHCGVVFADIVIAIS